MALSGVIKVWEILERLTFGNRPLQFLDSFLQLRMEITLSTIFSEHTSENIRIRTMLTTRLFFPFSTTVVYRLRFWPALASSSSEPSAIGESLVPSIFNPETLLGLACVSAFADGPGLFDFGFLGVLNRYNERGVSINNTI